MIKLDIANITIDIISDKLYKPNRLLPFYSSNQKSSNLRVNINSSTFIPKPENLVLSKSEINWVHSTSISSAYIYDYEIDKVLLSLSVDKNYNSASITYLESFCDEEYAIAGPLGEILFRNRILFNQGIVIHSSAIEWNSKGIIFSAPSNTGKSTQSNLWRKHMGANILNGDRPALTIIHGQAYVYGTPWSGTSPDFTNNHAPLSAIVMLQQASENSIQKLESSKAISYIIPRCFLPYHDSNLMNMAISNLEKIITTTPVYLLNCKPDKEAVELVYQWVK